MGLWPDFSNNDGNPARRRRMQKGIFGLWPFVALRLIQIYVAVAVPLWLLLIGPPITIAGLYVAVRNWSRPKMLLIGAVIALFGNAFPFFLVD